MLTPLAAPAQAREARADAPREISYRQWDTTAELRTGLSNSMGLGGHNACLILRRVE